jgi:competence ComEA-like helix-hairpin-helix protein
MKRRKIRTVWKDYLTLSIRERRGLTVLLLILFLQVLVLWYVNSLEPEFPYPDFEKLIELAKPLDVREKPLLPLPTETIVENFDPNHLQAGDWARFGLTERQAQSISNYLAKGGKFRVKSDLKKIYGMRTEIFARLEPHILLPDSLERFQTGKKTAEQKMKVLNINNADSIQLEKLRGVGFTLAARIIKYRNKLGGFNSIDQLKEVWGLNDTLFRLISSQVSLEATPTLNQLDINSDSPEILSQHPYVGRKLAYLIVNYRSQHGPFKRIEELKNLPLLTDEMFRKLAPYLKAG